MECDESLELVFELPQVNYREREREGAKGTKKRQTDRNGKNRVTKVPN